MSKNSSDSDEVTKLTSCSINQEGKVSASRTELCLHQIFERNVEIYPNNVAVSTEARSATYEELNRSAESLAQYLREIGITPGSMLGLCMDRDIEMIAGLLAILKVGCAYVPIDPNYPKERIKYLFEDSCVQFVITKGDIWSSLDIDGPTPVYLDDFKYYVNNVAGIYPQLSQNISDAAYIIYTSGSTGAPKGVIVEHRSVTRLYNEMQFLFGFCSDDVWSMSHSISFDFSVWEIWGALLFGGELVLLPYEITRSPDAMVSSISERGVTIFNQTPGMFNQFVKAYTKFDVKPKLNLRFIIFGGERLDIASLEPWFDMYGDEEPELINMYGITETTIHVTYHKLCRDDLDDKSLSPIGLPIPDLNLIILDDSGNVAAPGIVGDLYVGGPGVSRGYLNRPELTKDRFLPEVLGRVGPYYKTGDRVHLTESGYYYSGRSDDQIKIRGFRVEPREIEICLKKSKLINEIVIVTQDYGDGDMRLLAYFTSHKGGLDTADSKLISDKLMAYSANFLPNHMCPSRYVFLKEMPRTNHGKIDYVKLKSFDQKLESDTQSDTENQGTLEQVRHIWQEILIRDDIGVNEDFFDIGGTSFALLRIIDRLESSIGVSIDIGAIINNASILEISRNIDRQKTKVEEL